MFLAVLSNSSTATTVIAEIVLAGVALIGGVIAVIRALLKKGADAEKLYARLGQQDAETAELSRKIDAIERAQRPNGLDTDDIGDVAKRVEMKLDVLASKLDRHIGATEEAHRALWRAVERKADR